MPSSISAYFSGACASALIVNVFAPASSARPMQRQFVAATASDCSSHTVSAAGAEVNAAATVIVRVVPAAVLTARCCVTSLAASAGSCSITVSR